MPAKIFKFALLRALSRERTLLQEQLENTAPEATLRRMAIQHALAYVEVMRGAATRGATSVDLRPDVGGELSADVFENESRLALAGLGLARTAVLVAQHEGLHVVMDEQQAHTLNASRAFAY